MARPGGNPDFDKVRNRDNSASVRKQVQKANEKALEASEGVQQYLLSGGTLKPYSRLAEWLNDNGYVTGRNGRWSGRTVSRLVKRIIRLRQP